MCSIAGYTRCLLASALAHQRPSIAGTSCPYTGASSLSSISSALNQNTSAAIFGSVLLPHHLWNLQHLSTTFHLHNHPRLQKHSHLPASSLDSSQRAVHEYPIISVPDTPADTSSDYDNHPHHITHPEKRGGASSLHPQLSSHRSSRSYDRVKRHEHNYLHLHLQRTWQNPRMHTHENSYCCYS